MKKRSRTRGIAGVALFFIALVVILILAPRYPTMIERRIESRRLKAESTYRAAQPDLGNVKTLEIIMPDGKAYEVETFLNSRRK